MLEHPEDKSSVAMSGLDKAEAEARLAQFGPNVLQEASSRGFFQIMRGTLREPMFLFLLMAAALYLVVGDLAEGLFLVAGAFVSIGLVVVQELRSARSPPYNGSPSRSHA